MDNRQLGLVRGLIQWAAVLCSLVESEGSRYEAWQEECDALRDAIDQCIEEFGIEDCDRFSEDK